MNVKRFPADGYSVYTVFLPTTDNCHDSIFFVSCFVLFPQLGVVLLEQGKSSQALAYLDKALEIDPDHGQALLNSAILLQEIGRPDLRQIARERLLKLLTMDGMTHLSILIRHSTEHAHNFGSSIIELGRQRQRRHRRIMLMSISNVAKKLHEIVIIISTTFPSVFLVFRFSFSALVCLSQFNCTTTTSQYR